MGADAQGPLGGMRVAEWTGELSGGFAGWLLGALGASIVRLDGAAPRTPAERTLHRGKAPLAPTDAATWADACRHADVALLDDAAHDASTPAGVVRCAIRLWGERGPRRTLPPREALVAAATGVFGSQWSWTKRPVWMVTPMVSYMTGILAALGAVAAHFAARRGAGAQDVRVSGLQGALALNTGTYVTGPKHTGSLLDQGDPRGVYPTYGLYRTADGWLFVGALTEPFWVKLLTTLERIDLLAHERLQGSPLSFGAPDLRAFVRAELEPLFVARPTAEWVDVLRAADVPCGAVGSRLDFLRDAEARDLGLVVPIDDPVLGPTWQPAGPAAFSDTPVAPPAGSPDARARLAAWSAARPTAPPTTAAPRSVLDGIRVLDVTSYIAGPVCPMLLADLGADVVKIESPSGDPFRYAAFAFVGWNRGKRSIVLDLQRPDARRVFRDLARSADVLVDNLRAGVLDRLGVGWEALRAENPRLVHLSITGFGSSGPLTHLPGFDPVFQARSGLMQAQGGDDEPVFYTIPYNDYCAGALGALAVVAALVARERTGRGQRVDVSLFRTALVDQLAEMVLWDGAVPARGGGRDYLGPSPAERLYQCADGWVCVDAHGAEERTALARFTDDAPAAWFEARSRADALAALADLGVPAVPVLGFAELFADAHLRANDAFRDADDPALGAVTQCGAMIDLARTPIVHHRSAPRLGEHGPELLAELGYDATTISALLDAGAVGRPR